MIKSFKSRETEKIFSRQRSERLPEEIQRAALRELRSLDRALAVQDVWISNGAHAPAEGAAHYSILIDDDWRICFEWRDGHIYDVEIVDGHCPPPGRP
jgi:toxin HigB-1